MDEIAQAHASELWGEPPKPPPWPTPANPPPYGRRVLGGFPRPGGGPPLLLGCERHPGPRGDFWHTDGRPIGDAPLQWTYIPAGGPT